MIRNKRTSSERSKASRKESALNHGASSSTDEELDQDLRQGIQNIMKLRDEYDRLEGALKKLGVEPDCSGTEEEGYNAESDPEDDEQPRGSESYTVSPATILQQPPHLHHLDTSSRVPPGHLDSSRPPGGLPGGLLDRVDEVDETTSLFSPEAVNTCPESGKHPPGVGSSVHSPHSETESTSGFSTLRKRSVNVTEKVRQNRDGSKIQVVRESAVSTSTSASSKEPNQSVTFQQNSFVYVNGEGGEGSSSTPPLLGAAGSGGGNGCGSLSTAMTTHSKPSDIYTPTYNTYSSIVPSSSISDAPLVPGGGSGGSCGSTGLETLASAAAAAGARSKIVRLNSVEPNTVMFSTKDYPTLSDVSVPEIIDELERQFDSKLCEVQGVRLAGKKIFICLSKRDCLNYMAQYGFYVRGVHVTVMDISNDSVVICLIGVPHYITDSTITMLVGTFGVCIGEVERRFYKGVDTGERYVRLKPKPSCQIPDFVTVGGCKILVRVLDHDEVVKPFVLESETSRCEPLLSDNMSVGSGSFSSNNMNTTTTSTITQPTHHAPHHRSKPGHCNGTSLNSPPGSSDMPPPPPPLNLSSSTVISSSNIFSPQMASKPYAGPTPAESNSSLSLPSSPKIAKSFRSRLNVTLKSPTEENAESTYVPGESVDGFTALSPPPGGGGGCHFAQEEVTTGLLDEPPPLETLSPRSPDGFMDGFGGMSATTTSVDENSANTGTIKRSSRGESPGAASLRKYAIQNNNSSAANLMGSNHGGSGSMVKAESDQSLISMERMCSLSEAGHNGSTKRTSVVFEEPKPMSRSNNTLMMAQARQMSTSKTVNGILRKGSLREEAEEQRIGGGMSGRHTLPAMAVTRQEPTSTRKSTRRSGDSKHKAERHGKHSRSRDREPGDEKDGGKEDKDKGDKKNSRSRSNSTKAAKDEKSKKENLALTRDLPWCGCWGNGCL